MLGWWTIGRASGIGASAGLVALLLWPVFRRYGEAVTWPFAAAAAVAGLCGLSILLITAADTLFHRRGRRMRPVRGFDIGLGLLLVVLALLALDDFKGQLSA